MLSLSEKIKDKSHNTRNRRSGEMVSIIFETYKNSVIPHGFHVYKIASNMTMDTMRDYTYTNINLP